MHNYTIPVSKKYRKNNSSKWLRKKQNYYFKSWLLTNFPYLYSVISYFDMCTYPYRSWENMHMRVAVFDWLSRWRHWVDNNKVVFWLADFCLCTFGSNHLVNQKGHSDLRTKLCGALQVYNSFLKFFCKGRDSPEGLDQQRVSSLQSTLKAEPAFFPHRSIYTLKLLLTWLKGQLTLDWHQTSTCDPDSIE